jgi:hypothetical protein
MLQHISLVYLNGFLAAVDAQAIMNEAKAFDTARFLL